MDDETIARVVFAYSSLKDALRELESMRNSKNGAILDYVVSYYKRAQENVKFLDEQLTPELQDRMDLQTLERQLIELGNIHIQL